MSREEQANNIKMLLIGEILIAVSSIGLFRVFVPGMVFISILSVFGLVMTLIASIRLREASEEFRLSFIATIVALILAILADIFLISAVRSTLNNSGNVDTTMAILASAFSAAEMLVSIYVVFKILKGCRVLVNQVNQYDSFGYYTTIIYAVLAAVAIGLSVATASITNEQTLKILFSVLVGIDIAAGITYIVALARTHSYLSLSE